MDDQEMALHVLKQNEQHMQLWDDFRFFIYLSECGGLCYSRWISIFSQEFVSSKSIDPMMH